LFLVSRVASSDGTTPRKISTHTQTIALITDSILKSNEHPNEEILIKIQKWPGTTFFPIGERSINIDKISRTITRIPINSKTKAEVSFETKSELENQFQLIFLHQHITQIILHIFHYNTNSTHQFINFIHYQEKLDVFYPDSNNNLKNHEQ
jgi:hypothetical protein